MTQTELKNMFIYDDGNIYRTKRAGCFKVGSKAGSIWKDPKRENHKYMVIKISGKEYKLHRIIWCLINGKMPDGQIDHINGDTLDNRIENLRVVDNVTNSKNRGIQSNNTTGYHGITRHNGRFRVRINHNGKRLSCGVYDTFEEALSKRLELEEEYGYHKNHGRKLD